MTLCPASRAASTAIRTSCFPAPRPLCAGFTASGPRSSAGRSPIRIGVSRTEATNSSPASATKERAGSCGTSSRSRKAARAKRPGPKASGVERFDLGIVRRLFQPVGEG